MIKVQIDRKSDTKQFPPEQCSDNHYTCMSSLSWGYAHHVFRARVSLPHFFQKARLFDLQVDSHWRVPFTEHVAGCNENAALSLYMHA